MSTFFCTKTWVKESEDLSCYTITSGVLQIVGIFSSDELYKKSKLAKILSYVLNINVKGTLLAHIHCMCFIQSDSHFTQSDELNLSFEPRIRNFFCNTCFLNPPRLRLGWLLASNIFRKKSRRGYPH